MAHTTHHSLFGPWNLNGSVQVQPGSALQQPGVTGKRFQFATGTWTACLLARWVIQWRPEVGSVAVRLAHYDDGPANVTALTTITSTHPQAIAVDIADITTAFNGLITGAVAKNIGFRVQPGFNAEIYDSHLEITWT